VTAAVVGIPADLYHFMMDGGRTAASTTLPFRFHGLALIAAFTLSLVVLAALVLAQQGRAGRLGAAGAGMALAGTALVLGDLAKEAFGLPLAPEQLGDPQGYYLAVIVVSFGLLTTGWVLTAQALRRAGVISRRAALLLTAGALLAFPPIPAAYVVLLLGLVVAALSLDRAPAAPVPGERQLAAASGE
jgi:hypothetical protein